jgi:hypothetical protein
MSARIDQAATEKAIVVARERIAKGDREGWWTISDGYLQRLADVAEAHLATLPQAPTKLVWKVTEGTSSRTFDHIQEALATAGIWLRQSAGDVTISRCSVPA